MLRAPLARVRPRPSGPGVQGTAGRGAGALPAGRSPSVIRRDPRAALSQPPA
jgi:hypothetical protein